MSRVPEQIRRDQHKAQYFVRWGGNAIATLLPAGVAVVVPQFVDARSPTPAAWALVLSAEMDSPPAGIVFMVRFTARIGLGSGNFPLRRVLLITALAPALDVEIPVCPALSIQIEATVTPSAGFPATATMNLGAGVCPLAPKGFQYDC